MMLAKSSQDFTLLVNEGFRFFRPLFPKLLPIILLSFLAYLGYMIVGGLIVFGSMMLSKALGMVLGFCFFIGAFLLQCYFFMALLQRSYGVLADISDYVTATWSNARQRYLTLAGALFLMFFIMFAAGLVINLLIYLISMLGSGWLMFASAALAMVFFIYLSLRFILVGPVVAMTSLKAWQAVKQSFQLTRGNWWRCFGTLFLVVIIPSIGFMALNLLFARYLPPGIFAGMIGFIISVTQMLVVPVLTLSALFVLANDLQLQQDPVDK